MPRDKYRKVNVMAFTSQFLDKLIRIVEQESCVIYSSKSTFYPASTYVVYLNNQEIFSIRHRSFFASRWRRELLINIPGEEEITIKDAPFCDKLPEKAEKLLSLLASPTKRAQASINQQQQNTEKEISSILNKKHEQILRKLDNFLQNSK